MSPPKRRSPRCPRRPSRSRRTLTLCPTKSTARPPRLAPGVKSKPSKKAAVMADGCIIPPQVKDEALNQFKFDAGNSAWDGLPDSTSAPRCARFRTAPHARLPLARAEASKTPNLDAIPAAQQIHGSPIDIVPHILALPILWSGVVAAEVLGRVKRYNYDTSLSRRVRECGQLLDDGLSGSLVFNRCPKVGLEEAPCMTAHVLQRRIKPNSSLFDHPLFS